MNVAIANYSEGLLQQIGTNTNVNVKSTENENSLKDDCDHNTLLITYFYWFQNESCFTPSLFNFSLFDLHLFHTVNIISV
mmetsp:Transcript_24937/g.22658  ORF Transcript_24937/g.22658 Transcript_24937/m.22658 type:complete len:80 (+) Transcript_24937:121-360(+)